MQRNNVILAVLAALCLSGCWLNPYSSEFNCPKTANGKCISVSDAYTESLKNDPQGKTTTGPDQAAKGAAFSVYEEELFRKMTAMIKEPATPIVNPGTVLRGLVLYYSGEERELYSHRYVFFFVDEPRFVLGDYLNADIEGGEK
jgi:conjugal transfer pilus assembly protein TraV